ncbi:F510_1955 family glycosylhydrolase [Nocardioides limicola]|uniref:F510_1955 family glycosylhydrolase n=1 Tax=Nocardioides limicola TaxID=2803368 RepID=UPI00193BF76F|nr:exo-alpha-sialidase [Nocardioides sp. DJM-14]
MRRAGWAAMLTVVALSASVGCSSPDSDGQSQPSTRAQLAHVHGLGVDPADGTLYVGSHHGLFTVPVDGDSIEGPVAGLIRDFMGFTIIGPGHFLGSGHPGPGDDALNPLGLIESTDGGQTWTTRSLSGEVDFHALTYRHGTAYGVDAMSGQLLVSTDLVDWEVRSTEPMIDVAVSPDDADTLLATTPRGVLASSDGGRSFSALEPAPQLLLLSWAEDGTLVGVDPGGTVFVRAPTDAGFTRVGQLAGAPEALYAVDGSTVYAAARGALWRSTDGGATFQPHPS